jgi:hypothetical protein
MEIIIFVAALVLLDVLAQRFGRDSRPTIWDEERKQQAAALLD